MLNEHSVREVDGNPITLYLSVGYVNHKYEEFAHIPAKELLGHTVREFFPFLGDDWYQDVKNAALDGKVVEGEFDVPQDREMLGDLLSDDYDILYASDGVEAMKVLRSHKNDIALVILDLYMPNMSGQEVLAEMQGDENLKAIPVIVLTVDHNAELECLEKGAMDFIPKPYPDIGIVKARIAKCIALSEKQ